MSPLTYCCLICGYDIRARRFSGGKWIEEFRVIWSDTQGCFISGVGIYDDDQDQIQAPTDPAKRCDDEDYDPRLNKSFHVNICQDGARAFLSHNACWKLLEEAFKPNNIPLERFVDVCTSLPLVIARGCFHWGHTYGGIRAFDRQYIYPWECRFANAPSDIEALRHSTEDPYHIPELSSLTMETTPESPVPERRHFNDHSTDCFGVLSWEIREAIAKNLATRDALTMRESSRSFVPLLESSAFWASRFGPGADRGFLFEKTFTTGVRDWFSLYRRTSRKQSPPGLKNRIRIWKLVDHVFHLVKLSLSDGVHKSKIPPPRYDESMMIEAAAKIVQPSPDGIYPVFPNGCRISWTQSASIPRDLVAVGLSFIEQEDYCYLTGLSLNTDNGQALCLGYESTNTVLYQVKNFEDLKGMVLAIDTRGIRAVKIVHGNGDRSQWFGSPKGTPVTERLAIMDTTQPIRISVDGFKIVSIAASIPEDLFNGFNVESSMSLRAKAFWYPSVPSGEININEESFIQAKPFTMEYSPLQWVHFGGPQGAHLRRLVDVSLEGFGRSGIITFYYTQERSRERAMTHFGAYEPPYWTGMTSHSIDGPKGEQIQSVQVARHRHHICALKLITNTGEIFESGTTSPPKPFSSYPGAPMRKQEAEAEFETISIVPGTTITGFYASHKVPFNVLELWGSFGSHQARIPR